MKVLSGNLVKVGGTFEVAETVAIMRTCGLVKVLEAGTFKIRRRSDSSVAIQSMVATGSPHSIMSVSDFNQMFEEDQFVA